MGGLEDGPVSPCARGGTREEGIWLAAFGAAPAPAAPWGVNEEEEEEGVLETGPLDTTTHRENTLCISGSQGKYSMRKN